MTDTLDDIDLKLLDLLQRDGRMPHAELAKSVGLAISSVNERVRKMHDRGVIRGVYAKADPAALGLGLLAFIFVGWGAPDVEPRFLRMVKDLAAIQECHHVTGPWNYLLKVRVKDTQGLEAFLSNMKKFLPGLLRTESLISLSSAKETSALELPVAVRARK